MLPFSCFFFFFFFFNDTATTEIYTLSLHDALPISAARRTQWYRPPRAHRRTSPRSEEHTSELQSRFGISYAVFCLKKKKIKPELDAPAHSRAAHTSTRLARAR